jgi:hypothetical protein
VLLDFVMEFQARQAVAAIRKQVATTAAVLRDGQEKELPDSRCGWRWPVRRRSCFHAALVGWPG